MVDQVKKSGNAWSFSASGVPRKNVGVINNWVFWPCDVLKLECVYISGTLIANERAPYNVSKLIYCLGKSLYLMLISLHLWFCITGFADISTRKPLCT